MSELGQTRKYSPRAHVFRSAPNNGHMATTAACPFRAISRLMHCSKVGKIQRRQICDWVTSMQTVRGRLVSAVAPGHEIAIGNSLTPALPTRSEETLINWRRVVGIEIDD